MFSCAWIDRSCALLHMDFIPSISISPFHTPMATSVSNLKNTMSPHSSILNTYPSNLQADPITRICHGTHSQLLLDWSRGDWGGGGEHGRPGFGLFWGLNSIHRISITKASSAACRRDLGACQGQAEEVNSLKPPPPHHSRVGLIGRCLSSRGPDPAPPPSPLTPATVPFVIMLI